MLSLLDVKIILEPKSIKGWKEKKSENDKQLITHTHMKKEKNINKFSE